MFGFKKPVSRDKEKVRELLERGVSSVYPSKELLEQRLQSGERLTVYLGIDPTGSTLHLGHAITLRKLSQFQALGHEVILLIGDFTATIGDPTDKTAARVSLSTKEVIQNARLYKQQAAHLLDFHGANKAVLKYNSKWLAKMSMSDLSKLFSMITYAQTIKRDMFQKRIADDKDLFLHEFMYPVLQGYDSVAMDVDGEVGGNDQVFNMLVGRDLMKKIKNKEKFVLATKLLTDSSGKKMGKTEGNMVALNEDADQMLGKIMSWDDALIILGFELCTGVALGEIADLKRKLEQGMNPRDAKLRLAKEIVALYHGASVANTAEENFEKTFRKGEMPIDAPRASVAKDSLLVDALLTAGLVPSKSEFKRLVASGALSLVGGEAITDERFVIQHSINVRVGKHRFIAILVQ
ncbi:MAG: tyrosine--tRNA ligase [Candidatus Taylorbacteria bacterium RIFCSPHIGHO2_01_FULL_46_22b]|uniref:Tyrosine--tRNA ligase n=1 Tax=Candidatus Taylorbacteria bacterium RIFCSPHIGHO2_01_FULL_46_22b TaxID=1802301 RepID=A0A1G2M248_9BACT|nr:MAG: tyrosine--tRNA ligase [Candidatus Taylorbacteria bacterium RIFCSPHIGHO2_01_FULL_46_22b]